MAPRFATSAIVSAAVALGTGAGLSPSAARADAAAVPRAGATASLGPAPLHLGSRGSRVRLLQRRLIALGYLPSGSAGGTYGMRTWHAVVAFEGWERLPRDGVADLRMQAKLATAVRPRPWRPLRRALQLDLRRQVLLVVVRGTTRRVVHISSAAAGYVTPRGRFEVYRRERMSWSARYHAWMPHALYFSGGYAVHGYATVPAYPASHGCVRVPLDEAPFVYAAAPLGTPVLVR